MKLIETNLERIKSLWLMVVKTPVDRVSLETNVTVNFNSSMPNHVQLELSGKVWVPIEEYREFERKMRDAGQ